MTFKCHIIELTSVSGSITGSANGGTVLCTVSIAGGEEGQLTRVHPGLKQPSSNLVGSKSQGDLCTQINPQNGYFYILVKQLWNLKGNHVFNVSGALNLPPFVTTLSSWFSLMNTKSQNAFPRIFKTNAISIDTKHLICIPFFQMHSEWGYKTGNLCGCLEGSH